MNLKLVIDGHKVEVIDGPYQEYGQITDDGTNFAKDLMKDLDKYRNAAADNMLSLYNEARLDDDVAVPSKKEFAEGLILSSIELCDEKGAATLYFNDTDVFSCNYIEMSISDFNIINIGTAENKIPV